MDISQVKAKAKKEEIPDDFSKLDEILNVSKTFTTKTLSGEVSNLRKEMIMHKEEIFSELKSCLHTCEKEVSFLIAKMEEQHRTLGMKRIPAVSKVIEAQTHQFGWRGHRFAELCKQKSEPDDVLEHNVSELQKPQLIANQKLTDINEELNVTLRSVADISSKLLAWRPRCK